MSTEQRDALEVDALLRAFQEACEAAVNRGDEIGHGKERAILRDELRAALLASRIGERHTWAGAATAPKTGEHILVTQLDRKGFGMCGGKSQDWCAVVHYWPHQGEEGFYLSSGASADDRAVEFSHWKPLVARVPEPATGAELIAAERQRQVRAEGWSASHDDSHNHGELAISAACYAAHGTDAEVSMHGEDAMPWGSCDDKRRKHDRVRQLTIAGALIAAEIDRLLRLKSQPSLLVETTDTTPGSEAEPYGLPAGESYQRNVVCDALTDALLYVGDLAHEAGERTTIDLRDTTHACGLARLLTTSDVEGYDDALGENIRVLWEKIGRATSRAALSRETTDTTKLTKVQVTALCYLLDTYSIQGEESSEMFDRACWAVSRLEKSQSSVRAE